MDDSGPRAPPPRTIAHHLARMQALLQVVSPHSPFQPILTSSIDLMEWADLFGESAEAIEACLRRLPKNSRHSTASDASGQLFSLADALCGPARTHCRNRTTADPEVPPAAFSFDPDDGISETDAGAIEDAIKAARSFYAKSAQHRRLLGQSLDISIRRLAAALQGKGGLLRLMKAQGRKSRRFATVYGEFIATLEKATLDAEETAGKPWEERRLSLATLRHLLLEALTSDLDVILKQITSRTKRTSSTSTQQTRDVLKSKLMQAIDTFAEALLLSQSLDPAHALPALRLWAALSEPLAAATRAMANAGIITDTVPLPERLIDQIRLIPDRVICRQLLAGWNNALSDSDQHELEVVLAALDHLELPSEDAPGNALLWAFSEGEAASWLRRGSYRGANPDRVLSVTRAAESRRTRRTLHRLRRVGGAFHDRRQWLPLPRRTPQTTRHRYWTVNPLLILLPQVAARNTREFENAGAEVGRTDKPPSPRPSRRNKGKSQRP
jgi:hypothetical protein